MAYRRRQQGITRASTLKEEIYNPPADNKTNNKSSLPAFSSSQSFSASLFSAYGGADSAFASVHRRSKSFTANERASTRNESTGFWGVIARKAKAILEEDDLFPKSEPPARAKSRWQMADTSTGGQEGRKMVESKTADIHELQVRRKGDSEGQNQASGDNGRWKPHNQTYHETQLKASRDVAMATAAKAKLLLRDLKTVKADLAFAKQRSTQLEEENKLLLDSREKGQNPADDDLIRLQLETLLAEKARLANENSIYARENRFLREIVEYHQLTMQDVMYLDECSEEVTEVYPVSSSPLSKIHSASPPLPSDFPTPTSLPAIKEILHVPAPSEET